MNTTVKDQIHDVWKGQKHQTIKCKFKDLKNQNWLRMIDIETGFEPMYPVPINSLLVNATVTHREDAKRGRPIQRNMQWPQPNKFEFVVCPVNSRLDDSEKGCIHWSRLISENRGEESNFYHWDLAGCINTSAEQLLAAKLSGDQAGVYESNGEFVSGPCRRQSGVLECGAYTVCIVELVCSLACNNHTLFNKKFSKKRFSVNYIYTRIKSQNLLLTPSTISNQNITRYSDTLKSNTVPSMDMICYVGDSDARGAREMWELCEVTGSCRPAASIDTCQTGWSSCCCGKL